MTVEELREGLWRWTAYHAEWQEDVGSLYYRVNGETVLIDPLVPENDRERFFEHLDAEVSDAVHVLITVFWHARSTRELRDRYGARVWAYRRGRVPIANRAGEPTDLFTLGDELPGEIRAFDAARRNEVLFWIPRHRTLAVGDVLLGDGEGGIRTCPPSWLRSVTVDELKQKLRALLDLPIEIVALSHGRPVTKNARATLERALR